MANKKSAEERRSIQIKGNSVNIYVTPLNTQLFTDNFLQVQQSGNGGLFIGINYADENSSFGYDIKWVNIPPDTLDDLIVALAYAKHVVENGT